MSEWPSATIAEIAERVAMGPFGSSIKVSTFVPDGVPVISGQHLRESRLTDSDFNFVTEEHASKLAKANVQRGDVVLTHAGSIGQVAVIPKSSRYDRYVISQRQFYIRCDQSQMLPEFLAYYLRSPEGQHKILANANQTGVPSIAQPVSYIRTVEVPVPPLAEQRAIAGALGALDDKIESNRRICRLLEDEARAVFGHQFDTAPQQTGTPLQELVEINPSRALRRGTPATYVGMAALPTDSALVEQWEVREAGSGQRFTNGDVLLARITPCLENGKTALVDFLPEGETAWGSTEYIVFAPKQGVTSREWVYCLARSEAFVEYAVRNMTGTSGRQRCPATAFDQYYLTALDLRLLRDFGARFEPSFRRMGKARDENRVLAKLRDAILPELLFGRLRVRDAEQAASEAL